MARLKSPEPQVVDVPMNRDALAADTAALTVVAQRDADIDAAYGEGLPYDKDRLIGEARWYLEHSAGAMLEAGRRLILLKEHEPHGEFTDILEQKLKLAPRTARHMMQAAAKYLAPALGAKRQTSAVLNLSKSKLFELMVESDDDLEALADGGTLAGLTINEIDAMSARELRAALRKERDKHTKDAAAKDRVIQGKETKISALEEAIARRSLATGAEGEQAQIDQLRRDVLELEPLLHRLAATAEQVLGKPATTAAEAAARQAVEYVAQRLADLVNTHGLNVDLSELMTPTWLMPALPPTKKNG